MGTEDYKTFAYNYKPSLELCIQYINREILTNDKLKRDEKKKRLSTMRVIYSSQINNDISKIKDAEEYFDVIGFIDEKISELTLETVLNTTFFKNDIPIENSILDKNGLLLLFNHLRAEKVINLNNTKMGLLISQLTNYSPRISDSFSDISYHDDEEAKENLKKILRRIIRDLDK